MKPFLVPSPPLFVVLAGLACVFGAPACADQANPVLPPSGGHGGLIAGGGGTTGEIDALTPSDAADTAPSDTTTSGSDVLATVCDLLKQNCQALGWDARYACYPVGGAGRCETMNGNLPATSFCTANTDCEKGLFCAPQCGLGSNACAAICDRTDALSPTCLPGQVCAQIGGVDKSSAVGYCTTPC